MIFYWKQARTSQKHKGPVNELTGPSIFFGSPTWTRTRDLRINSPSLYRLSYQGTEPRIIRIVLQGVKA
jgi:hypothetical protein